MIILFLSNNICAQDAYIHRLGIEGRAGYIFPTSSFLRGENDMRKIMRSVCSAHLKYSFRLPPGTAADRVYGSSYQGIGLGYFDFGNRREMGTAARDDIALSIISLSSSHFIIPRPLTGQC